MDICFCYAAAGIGFGWLMIFILYTTFNKNTLKGYCTHGITILECWRNIGNFDWSIDCAWLNIC